MLPRPQCGLDLVLDRAPGARGCPLASFSTLCLAAVLSVSIKPWSAVSGLLRARAVPALSASATYMYLGT